MKLLLASSSPRRQAMLKDMDIPFEIAVSDADEIKSGEPDKLVMENARLKGEKIAEKYPDRLILSADTVVYLPDEKRILGKPKDEEDAKDMLRKLSGKRHEVYTGVCVTLGKKTDIRVDKASVYFDPLSEETIDWYVHTKEPMDKAGAYALQGKAGMFVRSIEGSYSCVIGLPMATVRSMLLPYRLTR